MNLMTTAPAGDPAKRGADSNSLCSSKSVLLINLGTPSAPDVRAVREYLREFLGDPYVIRLPRRLGWLNPLLGRLIARFRAAASAKLYRSIWTADGSPLLTLSQQQSSALQDLLPPGWNVFLAMRYGQPSIRRVLEEIRNRGITELVVVPMYPHFAGPSTGTALELFYKSVQEIGLNISVTVRTAWYDDASYIAAQAAVIRGQVAEHSLTPENTFLLFCAHSMPVSYIRSGDPYLDHITRSIELVRSKLQWPEDRQGLCFQSKLGPVDWLTPNIETTLRQLAEAGDKQVLVCPISFTADCLETIQELGMFYRDLFEKELGGRLHLCPALNNHPSFISALRSLVLRGPQRAELPDRPEPRVARTSQTDSGEAASLLMVGISIPNYLNSTRGPELRHDDLSGLKSVKLPAEQVTPLLHELCADGLAFEAWVLNTCNRFEVYAWVPNGADRIDRETLWMEIMRRVFGDRDHSQLAINSLQDFDAIHHLSRTAAGLNSVLPGETDIVDQLESSLRVARAAGTSGQRTVTLLTQVIDSASRLRRETAWGRYAPSNCSAMLRRLRQEYDCDWRKQRIAVIGRSTTCASMLKELVDQHDVPSEHITFIHKGSRRDGQIKKMRRLVPKAHKIRVESYDDSAVLAAVEDCDLVVYGIDQRRVVLDGRSLKSRLAAKPKHRIIIDFNSFGSTAHLDQVPQMTLWDIDRIEKEVAQYARSLCGDDAFKKAVASIEDDIEQCARHLLDQFPSLRDAGADSATVKQQSQRVAV
ncbi:MAG: ferrochelatase [Planctomycetes bacterium]|nr:ferrochelatase [Planctomycetota bacterium]